MKIRSLIISIVLVLVFASIGCCEEVWPWGNEVRHVDSEGIEWVRKSPQYDLSHIEGNLLLYTFNVNREGFVWEYTHHYLKFWEVIAEFTGLYNPLGELNVEYNPNFSEEVMGHHLEIIRSGDTLQVPYDIGFRIVRIYEPSEFMWGTMDHTLDKFNEMTVDWRENYEIPLTGVFTRYVKKRGDVAGSWEERRKESWKERFGIDLDRVTPETPLLHNSQNATDILSDEFWNNRGFECVSTTMWSILYGAEVEYPEYGLRDAFKDNMTVINTVDALTPDKSICLLKKLGLYNLSKIIIIDETVE